MSELNFARNLKRFRERMELSKEELGQKLGVSGATIGYWESGRNEPRMGKLENIADTLGVTTYELLFMQPINLNSKMSVEQMRALDIIHALHSEDLKITNDLMVRILKKNNT
ncbi:helix-turn-helix domain-containing protein [Paenibacillus xylanexedens]|uniref:helix-turn-helix domain-containing protein n=1 Tax=Paenibacillus xylanexedens TaxID=528191 RepID=UPI000F529B7D|nr:helix-turn-helix transcriptional regulator [Paenibacillus xylanexedens]RPK31732.1 hypothetical protein EDO6_02359 [Paenibacillus xylanexedens]